jgi:tetratricopeptide (TPR) repeat protein
MTIRRVFCAGALTLAASTGCARKPAPLQATAPAASAKPVAPVASATPAEPPPAAPRKFYDEKQYRNEQRRSMHLVMGARSMSEAEKNTIEQRIARNPTDLDARLIFAAGATPFDHRPSWRSNALWLIREYPDHPLVAQFVPIQFMHLDDEVIDIWTQHMAAHPDDVVLLQNAAMFYEVIDKKRSLEIYQRLRKLQPDRYEWAESTAREHWFAAETPDADQKAEQLAALADYRAALSLAGPERHRVLPLAADAALAQGETTEAEGYADELLRTGNANANELHRGHILLGRIALSKKHVKEASAELLLAGKVTADPVLQSFGPDMTLASDLWNAGAHAATSEYLKECRSLWTTHLPQLDEFIAAAGRGEKPNFNQHLPPPIVSPKAAP